MVSEEPAGQGGLLVSPGEQVLGTTLSRPPAATHGQVLAVTGHLGCHATVGGCIWRHWYLIVSQYIKRQMFSK